MLWHQSLKSIHYRTLLIFQTKKTTDLRVKTWGGIKDMLSPPCQNMGGIYHPHPPRIYALDKNQPQKPTTITNHKNRPQKPSTKTDYENRPQEPTTKTDHKIRPQNPTTKTDYENRL